MLKQQSDFTVTVYSVRGRDRHTSRKVELKDVEKIGMFSEVFNLKEHFLRDLKTFVERNQKTDPFVCSQCFKAYLLKTAYRYDVPRQTIEFFSHYFACETGHSGYFLDAGLLRGM